MHSSPRRANRKIEIALDIAFQCSPDHPYVKEHPRVVSSSARRHDSVRRESAEEISGYLSASISNATIGKALWEELKSVFLFWVGAGGAYFSCR